MPPRNRLAQTQPMVKCNRKPRWDQLAATSIVPVSQFRGIADVSKSNTLLRPKTATSTSATQTRSRPSAATTSRSHKGNTASGQAANDLLNDPDCIQIRDHVEEPRKLDEYDNHFLMKLAAHLRLYSQSLARQGNYKDAKKAVERRDFVINVCKSRKPVEPQSNAIRDLEKVIREYKEKWEKEIKELDDETAEKLKELEARNEEELKALDEDWKNNIVEHYRKPSADLIRQRTLEAKMIQMDQLDFASYIHQSVSHLEKNEAISAQAQFERDYLEARRNLVYSQQQEIETFIFARKHHRDLLMTDIMKDECKMNNRLSVLKTKPKPLEPYKHPDNEVASRPSAVLEDSEDLRPGKKLPMLHLPKNAERHTQTSKRSESQTVNRNKSRNKSESSMKNNNQMAQTQPVQNQNRLYPDEPVKPYSPQTSNPPNLNQFDNSMNNNMNDMMDQIDNPNSANNNRNTDENSNTNSNSNSGMSSHSVSPRQEEPPVQNGTQGNNEHMTPNTQ
ncbi:hypothetical protein TRFO_22679 [Tritrichomonas foetus]|uniref:Uncharacterized protein n=1 Tax=Tritrichomonas foetus TaxID=1144522 RepID=A0A1J4KCU5_9EUKA|nr:hypothetical protein TRFO_22679 [Tritrichomonas foetus]|eukprot:OHT08760.1 hypothetical protein TRFO_22679 [Tritrichomonas foetus]